MLYISILFFSLHPVIRKQNKSDLSRAFILQPQGMWFHVKSLHLLYATPKYYYAIAMTSSRHHHDIAKTSSLRPRRISDISLSHAEGSPTIADSQNTSLTVTNQIKTNFIAILYPYRIQGIYIFGGILLYIIH